MYIYIYIRPGPGGPALDPCGPGACVPLGPLSAPIGPYGPCPCGHAWALMRRVLAGPPGPVWAPVWELIPLGSNLGPGHGCL